MMWSFCPPRVRCWFTDSKPAGISFVLPLYKSNRETLPVTHILSISGLASQLIYKIPSWAGGKQKFGDSSIGIEY